MNRRVRDQDLVCRSHLGHRPRHVGAIRPVILVLGAAAVLGWLVVEFYVRTVTAD
jgi:hypothetical protein